MQTQKILERDNFTMTFYFMVLPQACGLYHKCNRITQDHKNG